MSDETKELSPAEMMALIKDLQEVVKSLKQSNQEKDERIRRLEGRVNNVERDVPVVLEYGLPDAPRAHLLIFTDGTARMCQTEEAANVWINDPSKKQPLEVWEMKQRHLKKYRR